MNIINYNNLIIDADCIKSQSCNLLIGDSMYCFRKGKIVSLEKPDLVIVNASEEYIDLLLKSGALYKDLVKIKDYCLGNELVNNYPLKVLIKGPEVSKMAYIDSNGILRGFESLISVPEKNIIKGKDNEVRIEALESIIQELP